MNNLSKLNDGLSAEDNLLLRSWRRGELDSATEAGFEERLFLEPSLAKAALIDQQMTSGITMVDQRPRSHVVSRVWPLLAAASVGAMAVMPFALRETRPDLSLGGNVEWVRMDHTRGSDRDAVNLISPSAATGTLVLELPAPSAQGEYSLRLLESESATVVLDMNNLHAVDGALTFALARTALKPGAYQIEIRAMKADASEAPASSLEFQYNP